MYTGICYLTKFGRFTKSCETHLCSNLSPPGPPIYRYWRLEQRSVLQYSPTNHKAITNYLEY